MTLWKPNRFIMFKDEEDKQPRGRPPKEKDELIGKKGHRRVVTRMPPGVIQQLDEKVREGIFVSRAEAVRFCVVAQLKELSNGD